MPSRSPVPDIDKETIINYNEKEKIADIFTYNKKLQVHLEGKMGLKPYNNNRKGGKSYKIDKARLRFPQLKRKVSEEAKKAGAERLKKANAPPANDVLTTAGRGAKTPGKRRVV